MPSFRQYALTFFLFYLVSCGLGYAALKRYDPRRADGLSDTAFYYQSVVNDPRELGRENIRSRLLVPVVAKPIYWIARRYLSSIDPALFALLLVNSFFCALTATILVSLGQRIFEGPAVALLGGALYLLSFAIANFYVAGMVDSAEACLLVGMTWLLLSNKWSWLPLLGAVAAVAKETFLPLGAVFALGWLLAERESRTTRWIKIVWVSTFVLVASLGLSLVYFVLAGRSLWPWQIAANVHIQANFAQAFLKPFTAASFWCFFTWPLLFGVWKLRALPRPWLAAAAMGTLAALLMSAWKDSGANAARPIFNVVGPMLSLSVAILISGTSEVKQASPNNHAY
jgi:uncharacterized membrane protein